MYRTGHNRRAKESNISVVNVADEVVSQVKAKTYWDKRIVLAGHIFLTVVSFLCFIIGILKNNDIITGIASNCFTAFIVTFLFTIVDWKTETDVERALRITEEETKKRIEDVEEITGQITSDLQKSLDDLKGKTGDFSLELQEFKNIIELYIGKSCTFCQNCIKSVKFHRDNCELEAFFRSAKRSICLLATNLESFTQYLPIFREKACAGVTIRVTTIHPDFARYFNISNVVGYTGPHKRWTDMRNSLLEFVNSRECLGKEDQKRFDIKTYSTITPTLILMISDDNCWVSYLLHGHKSRETPHFQFSKYANGSASPFDNFLKHFDGIWNDKGTLVATLSSVYKLEFFAGWNEAGEQYAKQPPRLSLRDFYDSLCTLWGRETCTERMRAHWSSDKPYIGQCTVTAFLIQDLFGGEVYGVKLDDGHYHSFNVIDGKVYDLTSQQFPNNVINYDERELQNRERHFSEDDKFHRYQLLKCKVAENLGLDIS